jgi:hypothetical protein
MLLNRFVHCRLQCFQSSLLKRKLLKIFRNAQYAFPYRKESSSNFLASIIRVFNSVERGYALSNQVSIHEIPAIRVMRQELAREGGFPCAVWSAMM